MINKRLLMNKKLYFGMFFIFGIFVLIFSSFASAYVQSSGPSSLNNRAMGLGAFSGSQSLRVDESMCKDGTDFIVQISPLSCTPTLVRSDLLEEENVNVYCQLSATKINPFVDVKAIDWIRFKEEYPKEVVGMGYHPAKSALGYNQETGLQGSALLNNLGYVMVTLRRQPNESALTNCKKTILGGEVCWVEGNLTATLTYDIENAFGVGNAVFYLPEMDDKEWQDNYIQYSFWNGRGYLRVNAVGENDATVSIYSDNSVARGLSRRNREYTLATYNSNIKLEKGKISNKIFLPGLSPCLASLQLELKGIENPNTRAVIKINEDYVEVAEEEKFLDNKCTLSSMNKKGISSEVKIRCVDEKSESFILRVFPKVNLSINGETKSYNVGDWLYKSEDGDKSVYLGYVGTVGDTTNTPKDLYVYLVALPMDEDTLTDSEISSVAAHAESIRATSKSGAKTFDSISESLKKTSGVIVQGFKWAIKGESFYSISYKEETASSNVEVRVEGNSVLLKGLSNPEDLTTGNEGYIENYKNAMNDFETVFNSFSQEVENTNSRQTLGEKALYEEIILANAVRNKKTVVELCKKFYEDYPNAYTDPDICKNSLKLSNSEEDGKEITINGITKRISLEEIKEPSINDYSATLLVQGPNGKEQSFDLRKNQQVFLDGFRKPEDQDKLQTGEYIMLTDLGTNTASIKVNIDKGFFNNQFVSDTESFTKGVSKKLGGNSQFYTFTLTNVNLKKVAKVSVIPSTEFAKSETSFKFKIGIEKRNDLLKLSPERAQEKINSLNKSIAEWQKASDTLYTVVKRMKQACEITGVALVVKNIYLNRGGKGIARHEVMSGTGGWNEKCTGFVSGGKYNSIDACFLDNAEGIETEVNNLYGIMDYQNKEIKQIETANMLKGTELAQDYVNTTGFVEDYSKQVRETLNSLSEEDKKNLDIENMETILTLDGWENNRYTIEQLREIELHALQIKKYGNDETAIGRLSSVLSDVEINAEEYVEGNTFGKETGMGGNSLVGSFDSLIKMKEISVTDRIQFKDTRYASMKIESLSGATLIPTNYAYAVKDNSGTGDKYILLYDDDGFVTQTYEIVLVEGVEELNVSKDDKGNIDKNPLHLSFKTYDKSSYENEYKSSYGSSSVLLRYYEDSPYKGFPSVVPFDLTDGWYAGVKTPQTSYDASGRVVSFWLCNVAKNRVEEFQLEGFGDDICQLFNLNTGQKYTIFPGLDESKTYNLVIRAQRAIENAQRGYKEGVTSVSIEGRRIKVGEPAVQNPASQCTDLMSAKDCSLLFNLCDPVICPSSRCNLGGNYNVKNVIQSGIIGSIALCYPNAKWNDGDVYVPFCLTGIQAGMDSWISVQQSYKDCLQTSLDTGETIGICDEINSIYTCEFFWKQALPIIKYGLPKLLGAITGQNKKGGGEYSGISSALETAKSSVDYFKQYYAADSYRAFKVRSTEEVGTEICGTFASLTYPDGGSLLDNLIEPDSPFQFTGKFQEISLTTVTNPPTSQYKVYYHIYAGKDSGAYYKVYLRGSGSSFYQDTVQNRLVNASYIKKGGYASATLDFTAPSGYKELCIVVNGQEECGFKEVSTSFAVNYVNDLYIAEQTSNTDIKTEKECISGTTSWYSALNLNVEDAASNLIDPALYSQGIIRICSTDNPGVGTDASAGTESARWKQVGYCGNSKIGCWIDTESVKDIIKTMNIEDKALKEVSEDYVGYLSEDYLTVDVFNSKIDEISAEKSDLDRINLINIILNKVFFNNQKAQLFFWRGKSYSSLAIKGYDVSINFEEYPCRHFCGYDGNVYYGIQDPETGICERSNLIHKNCEKGCNPTYGICVEDLELNGIPITEGTKANPNFEFNSKYSSPIFEFEDGRIANNICYRYYKSKWQWAANNGITGNCEGLGIVWSNVGNFEEDVRNGKVVYPYMETYEMFIKSLQSQESSYLGGFKLLVDATSAGKVGEGFFKFFNSQPDLTESTETTNMNHENLFSVSFSGIDNRPTRNLYFKYENGKWLWEIKEAFDGSWKEVSNYVTGGIFDLNQEQKNVLGYLKDKKFYEGAAILFDLDSKEVRSIDESEITPGVTTSSLEDSFEKRDLTKLTALMTSLSDLVTTSNFKCSCGENCEDYAQWIMDASKEEYVSGRENIPDELLLLAIMIQESSCKSVKSSGGDIGLMQINARIHCGTKGLGSISGDCNSTLLNDNEKNINVGAQILKESYRTSSKTYNCNGANIKSYSGWEAALRGYNGWGGTNCGVINYVEEVEAKYFELVDLYNGKSVSISSTSSGSGSTTGTPAQEIFIIAPTSAQKIGGATNMYYKYENGWKWTPYSDKSIWMSVSGITITSGQYANNPISDKNIAIIKSLNLLSTGQIYSNGKKILKDNGGTMEDGSEIFLTTIGTPAQEIFVIKPSLSREILTFGGATNMYYKYENGWKWTPYSDKSVWMSVSVTTITSGEYKGDSPSNKNIAIIEALNELGKIYADGKKILKDSGGKMEDGSEIVLSASGTTTTDLLDAAENGDLNKIKTLIQGGANIEVKGDNEFTPLIYAAYNGYLDIVKYLVEKGANLEAKGDHGETPLIWASHKDNSDVVKYLIEKGANIEVIDDYGFTSLLWATDSATLVTVKSLVEQGANIEVKDNDGETPLMVAVFLGKIDIVKYLVEAGANINVKDNNGKTVLDIAETGGSLEIINYLKSKGAISGTIAPSGQVCTPPVISPSVSALSDANEKVLQTTRELEGDSSSKALYSNCWEASYYVYTSAGVENKCVYSDVSGKKYSIQGNTINIGVDKKNENIIYQIASSPETQCSLNKQLSGAPTEAQKLYNIQPGDLLSIVYDADDGHNVVFVEWVDKPNKIARLFDWNGEDENKNKIFRYYESDLSDNQHPVYMYWEPVVA